MGLIGRLLSFARAVRNGAQVSDVKTDPGGGPNITAEHFSAPGDDSHPLPGDYCATLRLEQAGRGASVGYVDPINEPKAAAGEKRIYARDSEGAVVVDLWLKSDGTIRAENAAGYFELQPGGDVVANGAKLTADGDVVTSDGVSLRNHFHEQGPDSDGDTQQNTSTSVATE